MPENTDCPDMQQQRDRSWHFDRTINITNLLAIIGIIIASLTWANGMERRISDNSKDIEQIEERSRRDWDLNKEARTELKADIKEIKSMLTQIMREKK